MTFRFPLCNIIEVVYLLVVTYCSAREALIVFLSNQFIEALGFLMTFEEGSSFFD